MFNALRKAIILAAALCGLLCATPASAANTICPTAPAGDSTNKCASTAFVQNALSTGLPLTQNHIYVGNGLNLAADVAVSGDCTIVFGSPAVIRCPGTSTNGQVLANSSGAIVGLTNAQLTALINLATATLPGGVPAWPNSTTQFFRGDGTYAAVAFAGLTGQASLAQLPTLGASTVLGSVAGGTPIALSQAQLTALVNAFTTTLPGSVPAPGSITGKFLRDDGTWQVVSGTGTVTSITCFGVAITTTGTCATAATKSDQQTGSSTTAVVTPSQQQSHDSANKSAGGFTNTKTNVAQTLTTNYNMTSITRTGTGLFTVVVTTAFASSTGYGCHITANNAGANNTWAQVGAYTNTTTFTMQFFNAAGSLTDPDGAFVSCMGRQ